MKRKPFSEERIIGIPKEAEVGVPGVSADRKSMRYPFVPGG